MRESVRIAVERRRAGRANKSLVMIGLRGVGKTVLLDQMRTDADASGIETLRVEAPEGRSLPSILAPELRTVMLRMSRNEKVKALAQRTLRALAGFARGLKVKYQDIEVGYDLEPEAGLADNGALEQDLMALLECAGMTAREAGTALALFIDEMQYIEEPEFAALITALHRMEQRSLPVVLVGAGLPQVPGRAGRAKSYAERLFEFPDIGPLAPAAARLAIEKPANDRGVTYTPGAIELILARTERYAYFLQEWGKHAWLTAKASPISEEDVRKASDTVTAALDGSFFRVRFDRLTPMERRYLRAMAELGRGWHRSGAIAEVLRRDVTSLGPTRANLIAKGMVWSPQHGDTGFTVPFFEEYMKRVMPGSDWRVS